MDHERWIGLQNILADTDSRVNLINREYLLSEGKSNHLKTTFGAFELLRLDRKGKSFLDVGCETTILKKELKSDYTAFDIIGSDEIIQGDAHELPFKDNSFDIVFCSHTLEHVLSPVICINEMSRVLKENGDAVIGVPLSPHFMLPEHISVFDIRGWIHILRSGGLKVVDCFLHKELSVVVYRCKKSTPWINLDVQTNDKKVIVCVNSPKSGSKWLRDIMAKHPDIKSKSISFGGIEETEDLSFPEIERGISWVWCPHGTIILPQIIKWAKKGKFELFIVHLIRDGRHVSAAHGIRDGKTSDVLKRQSKNWKNFVEAGIKYRNLVNYLEIKYEDLRDRPANTILKICDFSFLRKDFGLVKVLKETITPLKEQFFDLNDDKKDLILNEIKGTLEKTGYGTDK